MQYLTNEKLFLFPEKLKNFLKKTFSTSFRNSDDAKIIIGDHADKQPIEKKNNIKYQPLLNKKKTKKKTDRGTHIDLFLKIKKI